jgi:hypothetical protein
MYGERDAIAVLLWGVEGQVVGGMHSPAASLLALSGFTRTRAL